MRDSA